MVVRDVESQGYPFIEAAASALSACDELVISDGGSRDRTWAGLEALRETFGGRVKLFRDPWPGPENRGAVLRTATNIVRRRCRASEWCFSVQANEILSERSARALRELPARHPGVEVFALPYLELMGPHLVMRTSVRRRLFRNVPDIVAVGDAYDVAAVLPGRKPTVMAPGLPEPIYRYRALFPDGYAAKLRAGRPRTPVWQAELALVERALVERTPDSGEPVAAFWERMRASWADPRWRRLAAGTGGPVEPLQRIDRAPAAARHLLWRWRYDQSDSVAWLAGRGAPPVMPGVPPVSSG